MQSPLQEQKKNYVGTPGQSHKLYETHKATNYCVIGRLRAIS